MNLSDMKKVDRDLLILMFQLSSIFKDGNTSKKEFINYLETFWDDLIDTPYYEVARKEVNEFIEKDVNRKIKDYLNKGKTEK
jgi:hypothetical protein